MGEQFSNYQDQETENDKLNRSQYRKHFRN